MAVVVFLLLIPVATLLLAASEYEIEDGRVCTFLVIMLLSSLLAPDVKSTVFLGCCGVLEFELSLLFLRKAHS